MKLNAALVKKTTDQIEAQALPDTHPAVSELSSLFGEHTFFLGVEGLTIVEPVGDADAGSRKAHVVQLAEWQDEKRSSLVPCRPQVTDVVVELDAGDEDEEPPKAS